PDLLRDERGDTVEGPQWIQRRQRAAGSRNARILGRSERQRVLQRALNVEAVARRETRARRDLTRQTPNIVVVRRLRERHVVAVVRRNADKGGSRFAELAHVDQYASFGDRRRIPDAARQQRVGA